MIKNNKGFVEIIVIIIVSLIIGLATAVMFSEINSKKEFGTEEGIIIDKKHTDSYTTIMYTHVNKVMIPHPIYHTETYQLKLSKTIDGEKKTLWVEVSKEIYDKLNIEDYYKKEE